ncbi:MAG: hypothetical protein WCJ74_02905 [bacterium]
MQKNEIKKIYKLDGYIFDKFEERDSNIILHCHIQGNSMKLKSETSKTVNQTRNRLIAHSMFEDKKVFISIEQRRFYFPKHKQKLWESLPQVKKKQQSTITFKKTL